MDAATPELMALAFKALDHGIESVRSGGPLVPFVMQQHGAESTLKRFVATTLEESLARAQESLQSADETVTAYAIAQDGFVTIQDERCDAVIVEVAERRSPVALVLCQRYRRRKIFRGIAPVGNAAMIGQLPNRLRPQS